MKKQEIVEFVARDARLKVPEAARAVTAVVNAIRSSIAAGGKISFSGLGTFKVKTRKARRGRNPQTGEVIVIPIGRKISFKPTRSAKLLVKVGGAR